MVHSSTGPPPSTVRPGYMLHIKPHRYCAHRAARLKVYPHTLEVAEIVIMLNNHYHKRRIFEDHFKCYTLLYKDPETETELKFSRLNL